MSFVVRIEQFDGPLDLMLHLIREKQLDIFNLDLAVLADQYIEYIHTMQKMNLDVASEYLVEMANLVEYKSKKMLPKNDEKLEGEYEEDKEKDLVDRLLEYQKFKDVSSQLDNLFEQRSLLHDKPQSDVVSQFAVQEEETYEKTSPYELTKAMKRVLNRYKLNNPYEISLQTQKISMEERSQQLIKKIKQYQGVFTLTDIMDDCEDVYDVVVTFLAVLQMVNDNYMEFRVKDEEVYFKRGVKYE